MRLRRPQDGQVSSKPDSFNSIVFIVISPQKALSFVDTARAGAGGPWAISFYSGKVQLGFTVEWATNLEL
jgi:hypothetical protein